MSTRNIWLSCGLSGEARRADVLALSELVLAENASLPALCRELRSEYALSVRQSIELAIDACRKLHDTGNPIALGIVISWCASTTHPLPEWTKLVPESNAPEAKYLGLA